MKRAAPLTTALIMLAALNAYAETDDGNVTAPVVQQPGAPKAPPPGAAAAEIKEHQRDNMTDSFNS